MANGRYAKRGALNPVQMPVDAPAYPRPARPNRWPLPVRLPGAKSPANPFRVPGRLPGDVFRRLPRQLRPFGLKVPPPLRFGPKIPFNPAFPMPWWIAPFFMPDITPLFDPANWSPAISPHIYSPDFRVAPYMELKCVANPQVLPPVYPAITNRGSRTGFVNAGDCGLSLQSWVNPGDINDPIGQFTGPLARTDIVLEKNQGLDRYRYHSVWWVNVPAGVTIPGGRPWYVPTPYVYTPTPFTMPNPNVTKILPSEPLWDPAEPYRIENPALSPSSPLEVPLIDILESVFLGASPPKIDDSLEVVMPPRVQPVTGWNPTLQEALQPRRPKKNTREKKVRGKTFIIMSVLDWISEAAEVVDATYKALPWEVRKKWEKEHAGGHWVKNCRDVRGRPAPCKWVWVLSQAGRHALLDNAGQYGISGADWKLQALWHNWRHLDANDVAKNVITNIFQDRFLGNIHQRLPKNIGSAGGATDEAFMKLSKSFDQGMQRVFEYIGWDDIAGSRIDSAFEYLKRLK